MLTHDTAFPCDFGRGRGVTKAGFGQQGLLLQSYMALQSGWSHPALWVVAAKDRFLRLSLSLRRIAAPVSSV